MMYYIKFQTYESLRLGEAYRNSVHRSYIKPLGPLRVDPIQAAQIRTSKLKLFKNQENSTYQILQRCSSD